MTTEEKIEAIVEKKFPRWMDEDYGVHESARYYYSEALRDMLTTGTLDALYEVEVVMSDFDRAVYYKSKATRL